MAGVYVSVYKGYRIEVTSDETPNGLWTATWAVNYSEGRVSETIRPSNAAGYGSQSEAEQNALAAAKDWIDKKIAGE